MMTNSRITVLLKYDKGELNPFDASALECALCSGCRDITVVAMAPASVRERLLYLTRLGVRAVLLSDHAFAGADTLATAKTLAAYIRIHTPDYIFCGRQSMSGDTAQVPPCLSVLIGYDFIPSVMRMEGNAAGLRNGETVELTGKQVLSFERIAALRFPSIRSKQTQVTVMNNAELRLGETECGQSGSPTKVLQLYECQTGRRRCEFVEFGRLDEIIQAALQKTERIVLEKACGERLREVFYIGNVKAETERIAEYAVELDIAGKSPQMIADALTRRKAKTVLFDDSVQMRILAPKIAGLLNAGLCADCTGLETDGEKLYMIRPAAGGTVTAKIGCRSEITMATVRTKAKEGSEVIVSIGRGAKHAVEQARALAQRLHAELACSRGAVDDGMMPYSGQVGLTGKAVAPNVYIAIGISGAVHHTCAIERAGTVIAVNPDKKARIFDYADYGIVTNF